MHTDSPVKKTKNLCLTASPVLQEVIPGSDGDCTYDDNTLQGWKRSREQSVCLDLVLLFRRVAQFCESTEIHPGETRRVVCGQTDEFAQTDACTRTRPRNFPKHFPANNKQQLFFTSVSRRRIEIRGALSSSHLLSCFRTQSENVTFPDFPYFRPHVTSRAGTHSVLLESFPI